VKSQFLPETILIFGAPPWAKWYFFFLRQVFVPLPSGMSTSVPSLTFANAEKFETRTGGSSHFRKNAEFWRPERLHKEKMWMLILKQADTAAQLEVIWPMFSNHRDFSSKKKGGISDSRPRGIYRASNTSPWVSWAKYGFGMVWYCWWKKSCTTLDG
jgi:hypothetical protein